MSLSELPRSASLRAALQAALGPRGMVDAAQAEAFATDWRGLFRGRPLAVVRPASAEEVAAVVRICAAHGAPIVPQGGNTGLVGGGVPTPEGREVVVSLARMTRLRAIDPVDLTLVADAGVTLAAAREAAAAADCLLPVSIGSEGTAQLGGIVATNAGGNTTVRYGNTRELVLGLEVVLPSGEIWHGLRRLRKDNAGYALRHLYVGSEGTLGIITGVALKLAPRPRTVEAAFCALPSAEAALELFNRFQHRDPASLQAFEYMSAAGVELVLAHVEGARLPIATAGRHYALIELATPRAGAELRGLIEEVLASAFEDGLVEDATVAQAETQRRALWRLREEHTEAQRRAGPSVKNDVSVPVSRVPELLRRGALACEAAMPGIRVAAFGHMGDGNIHFNLLAPPGMAAAAFAARGEELAAVVNDVVQALDGSFSAEHGIGQLKRRTLAERRSPTELELMRRIKRALDPDGLLNPGRIFS